MITDFFRSVGAYFEAIPAISKYGLWKYIIASALIGLLIGSGILYLAQGLGSNLGEFLSGYWRWETGAGVAAKFSKGISYGLVAFIFMFIYKYIIFIILAPLLSYVSEHIESEYDGTEPLPFKIGKFFKDMVRGLRIALRNVVKELFYTIVLLILGLFPLFTIFSGIGIYLVQAYYAGFGNMDYYMERRLSVNETINFVKRRKIAALTNGAIFLVILMIPVAGIMIAPFLGAISATLFLLQETDI